MPQHSSPAVQMNVAVLGIGRDIAGALGNPSSTAGSVLGLEFYCDGILVADTLPWCLKHQSEICYGNEKINAQIGDRKVYRGVWFLKETGKF